MKAKALLSLLLQNGLSFIGDATPYGWDNNGLNTKLQAGTERFTKTSDNPLQFTYEGHLNVGEFKLVTNNSDLPAWSNLIQLQSLIVR